MIVRTFDGVKALTPPQPAFSGSSGGSITLYGLNQTYAYLYKTQPNIRICVDFLGRNTAQLGTPVYRRVSDTDRERLVDHDLATWLSNPNPTTTRYRLVESLVCDVSLFHNAYWLKVRYVNARGRNAIGLVRMPPEEMTVQGGLLPTHFEWTSNGRVKPFPLSEIVYFNGYNPLNARMGLSPLETLRRILAEEAAAGAYRETYWRSGARMPGVVTRPATAKAYDKPQALDWRRQWQEMYGGLSGENTILLQGGETFTPHAFNAKDSEYTVGGKLRREICAAQWHIPQPMVGILEHATFSNIREQHKHLYQDCLGPTHEMITQEWERQILPECEDRASVYVEINVDAKLQGTPEERAASLYQAIGRPWVTVNEGRALENRPRLDDPALDTVAPQQGGPSDATAQPTRTSPTPAPAANRDDDEDLDARLAPILRAHRARQLARVQKLPASARSSAFFADLERWNRELAVDLTAIAGAEASRRALEANLATFAQLDALEDAA